MSCWKCGSGQHLYEITRYPASRNQIAGVGGNPEEIVPLEELSEADRRVVMRMSAESDDSKFYMVHEHNAKRAGLHFDLRLEHDGVLKSWAIPKGMPTSGRHLAIQTTDHSMRYGKWEGTIKSGYGAGEVKIDTSGRYETIQKSSSNWKFKILSGKYRGTWNLSHWKQDKWLITKVGDKKMSENFNAEDRPEEERMTRAEAEALAAKMINLLQPYADSIDVCGSYRRGREDPGDLDIVVILKPRITLPQIVEDLEGEYTAVNWVGEKKTQMVIDGVKVDVRTTTPRAKGAALLYFTGPAGYNIGIRRSAKSRGMKLNEYGIFDRETNEYLGGATEEEIYEILGKNFRPATERRAENVSFATEENNEMQEAIIRGLRNLARDGYVVAAPPFGNRSRTFYQQLSTEIMLELGELGSDDEGPEVTGSGRAIDPYNVVRSLARNESFSMPNNDNELSVGIADMIMSFTQQATMMDEQDGVGAPDGYTEMRFDLPYNGMITRRLAWKISHSMGIYSTANNRLYLYSTPQKNRNCSMIINMLLEDLSEEVAGMSDSEQEQFYQAFGEEIMRQVGYWEGPIREEYVRNKEWKIRNHGDTTSSIDAVNVRDDIKGRAVTAAQRLNPFSAESRAEGKMSLAQRLQQQKPKRKGQDYSLLTQEQLMGVGGSRFNTKEKRQAFIDYQKKKKARGNLMSRAEEEEVVTEIVSPLNENVTRSLGEIPDDVLRYMYRRGDISKMQMEIGIGLKMQAEEVQEFNAMVKAPKGWNKAGITEKVMMMEVMMQEARLQEALLQLETNIRLGIISEDKAMAMFAKLIG